MSARPNALARQLNVPVEILGTVNVPADGDCMFACVAKVLCEVGHQTTVKTLRREYAESLGPQELEAFKVRAAIGESGYKFAETIDSIDELRVYATKTGASVKHADKCLWGDEATLCFLARRYNLTILVCTAVGRRPTRVEWRFGHGKTTAMLHRSRGEHYSLLTFDGHAAQPLSELPKALSERAMALHDAAATGEEKVEVVAPGVLGKRPRDDDAEERTHPRDSAARCAFEGCTICDGSEWTRMCAGEETQVTEAVKKANLAVATEMLGKPAVALDPETDDELRGQATEVRLLPCGDPVFKFSVGEDTVVWVHEMELVE